MELGTKRQLRWAQQRGICFKQQSYPGDRIYSVYSYGVDIGWIEYLDGYYYAPSSSDRRSHKTLKKALKYLMKEEKRGNI